MSRRIKIIGSAFGDPLLETVFSGVSKYLFGALDKQGVMAGYLSTRQLRPWDIFSHALDLSKTFEFGKPGINVSWMWRRSTIDKLTARAMKKLDALEITALDYFPILRKAEEEIWSVFKRGDDG